jgi:aminopeptidase N
LLRIVLGHLLFPYSAASSELLQRTDEFLAGGDLDPGVARAVIEGRDVVVKALRARALDNDKQQAEAVAGR